MSGHDADGRRITRIIANAGSGKTYALSTRYIQIMAALLQREPGGVEFNASSVLATTFTRAAAGEIRNRILKRLADAALGGAAQATPEQVKARDDLARDVLEGSPQLRGAFDPAVLLQRLTQEFDRIEIRTIDSMFARLAQSFGREAGLPLPLQFLSETETAASTRRALQRVIDQSKDLEEVARRLQQLLYGVAASSVERVILEKISDGLTAYRDSLPAGGGDGIPAAWLPPAGAGARELGAEQLTKTLEDLRVAVQTMDKIPAGYAAMLQKLDPAPRTIQEWRDWRKSGPQKNAAQNKLEFGRKPIPGNCLEPIQALLAHLTALEDKAAAAAALGWAEFLRQVDAAWNQLMAAEERVTFESITRALCGAMQSPDMPDIFFRLDGRIDHLLLDEFQDTSVGQWRALRPLAQEIAAAGDDDRFRSLLVVGDPKQSIYGWRAGEPRLLRTFESAIHDDGRAEANMSSGTLSKSYRSAPVVLAFVDHLFGRLQSGSGAVFADPDAPALQSFVRACTHWTEGYARHEAAGRNKNLDGCVQVRALPHVTGASPAERERKLIRESAAIAVDQYRRTGGQMKIAIIARRNQDVAKLVDGIRADAPDVPCVARAGGDLQTSPAVVAFLDAMRFSAHPGDTISLFGAATTPLGDLLKLNPEWAAHHPDRDIRRQRKEARERAACGIRQLLARRGVARTFSQWRLQLDRLDAAECIFDAGDRLRLGRLIQEATLLERDPARTIDDIVDALAAVRVQDAPSNEIEVINIHQAKGLEWDAVIYHAGVDRAGNIRPTFAVHRQRLLDPPVCVVPWIRTKPAPPRYQPAMDYADDFRLQEELSQLYVALTRARQGLWITAGLKATGFGPTPAGMICDAISSMARPETREGFQIFTLGNASWPQPGAAAGDAHVAAAPSGGEQMAPRRRLVPVSAPTGDAFKVRARRSPSSASASDSPPPTAPARAAPLVRQPGALPATERGTIAHLVAESLRWSDDWKPDPSALDAKARALFPLRPPKAVADVVAQTIEQLRSEEIKSLLARPAGPAAVFNERKFVRLFGDGGVQEGTIDRVVLLGRPGAWTGALVIDFKTDFFDPAVQNLEQWKRERAAHHAPQLAAYARVLAQEHGIPLAGISMHLALLEARAAVPVHAAAIHEKETPVPI